MITSLCELLWLKRLLSKIRFAPSSTMNLYYDNKVAVEMSHNPIQHDHIKSIEVDKHFIKKNLE